MGSSPRPEFICPRACISVCPTQPNPEAVTCKDTYPEYRVDFLVMRHNPRDERKGAQTRPDIIWKEEEDESKNGKVPEETVPGECPAVCRGAVLGLVEGAEQDCGGE